MQNATKLFSKIICGVICIILIIITIQKIFSELRWIRLLLNESNMSFDILMKIATFMPSVGNSTFVQHNIYLMAAVWVTFT